MPCWGKGHSKQPWRVHHGHMFDPKSPLQAGLIFAAGLLVIGWTTLDINRVSRQNERPLTEEQLQALQKFGQEAKRKAFGTIKHCSHVYSSSTLAFRAVLRSCFMRSKQYGPA